MRQRAGLAAGTTFIGVLFGFGLRAHADNEHDGSGSGEHEGSAEHHEGSAEHHEGSAEHHEGLAEEHKDAGLAEHHEGSAEEHKDAGSAEHHEGSAAEHHDGSAAEHKDEGASAAEHAAEAAAAVEHEEALKGHEADAHDIELAKEANAGLPSDVDPDYKIDPRDLDNDGMPDDARRGIRRPDYRPVRCGRRRQDRARGDRGPQGVRRVLRRHPERARRQALEARPERAELKPSIDVETFRKGVRIVKKIVLAKMEKKIAKKSDKKMATFSCIVVGFSALRPVAAARCRSCWRRSTRGRAACCSSTRRSRR